MWLLYVCVSVCMSTCSHVCMCVQLYMWKPNVHVSGSMFPALCFPLLFETRSLTWTWSSLIQTNCLASKLHGSTCLHCLIRLGLQVYNFYIGVGGPNSCWHLCGKHFQSHLPSPSAMGDSPVPIIKWNDGSFLTLDCKDIQYCCCGAHRKGASHCNTVALLKTHWACFFRKGFFTSPLCKPSYNVTGSM